MYQFQVAAQNCLSPDRAECDGLLALITTVPSGGVALPRSGLNPASTALRVSSTCRLRFVSAARGLCRIEGTIRRRASSRSTMVFKKGTSDESRRSAGFEYPVAEFSSRVVLKQQIVDLACLAHRVKVHLLELAEPF